MTRKLALLLVLGLTAGCQSTVHPRAGQGVPPPSWVEVEKPAEPEEDPAEARNQRPGPKEIGARHILVSFKGAAHAPPTIGRTRDMAYMRAQEALARAKKGEDFAALAGEYSDEPGAAERGGDLGKFSRDKMVPRFSDAAFALEPGQISDVVETQFGFHIIQRTE